jgi:predicted alpha-1,2-mannosidase
MASSGIALIAARGTATSLAPRLSLVDAVNPLIGVTTDAKAGEGKTFPGAVLPYGLVQLSPDTVTGGDNASGYTYEHSSIEGFSFTHLSGVGWYGDFGNLQVMPSIGPMKLAAGRIGHRPDEGWRSPFRHETEVARAGSYAVTLDRYAIRAEAVAATHAGLLRFTFPKAPDARIQIDLSRRIGGFSDRQSVSVVAPDAIEGWIRCSPAGGGWGNGNGQVSYTLFFRLEFSKAFARSGTWAIDVPNGFAAKFPLMSDHLQSDDYYRFVSEARVQSGQTNAEADRLGFFAEFETEAGEEISVKAGISFVDIAGARANLAHDLPGWDVAAAQRAGRSAWNEALDGIRIRGASTEQRAIFATALYHCMIDPRQASDVDGRFRRGDGTIGQSNSYTRRTVFSGWDVHRGVFPLLTIIRPQVVIDEINSLLDLAEETKRGYLERWEIANAYSGCMSGDPATAVILDAHVKGLGGFDIDRAYAACRQTAAGIGEKTNRLDNDFYMERGFVPGEVSWTLDNAYSDWCVARLAESLGHREDQATFMARARNYQRIYDPAVQNMHARDKAGNWIAWKGATEFGQGCEESNPGQESFRVPHDVPGLMRLMGEERFVERLEELFERSPRNFAWNAYYNHANEPVHHVAYLFACAGRPWLTQKWVRRIMLGAYRNSVDGLVGNDDVGQMSAWYVLSAMGFYPVCPGTGLYVIGSPLFPEVEIDVGDRQGAQRRTFRIVANGVGPAACYIQAAWLNGVRHDRPWLTHREIVAGGELRLTMSTTPNRQWGTQGVPGAS